LLRSWQALNTPTASKQLLNAINTFGAGTEQQQVE
jgi:hypothetical protein